MTSRNGKTCIDVPYGGHVRRTTEGESNLPLGVVEVWSTGMHGLCGLDVSQVVETETFVAHVY